MVHMMDTRETISSVPKPCHFIFPQIAHSCSSVSLPQNTTLKPSTSQKMPSSIAGGLIYDIKLSSVGPGSVTDPGIVHEPDDMDLAMKLHYLRGIYYFNKKAFEGLTTLNIKAPTFILLNYFPAFCGRFRRAESGRPYIKCNDCGVRFIEGKCEKSLDEWLETIKENASIEKFLTPNQIVGPELAFSPTLLFQFTKFKCGGMSVGLSWAHVLGDAFSAAGLMNLLGKVVAGNKLNRPILGHKKNKPTNNESPLKDAGDPLSIKRVGPVGENWIAENNCKMEPFSFIVNATQLSHLQSKISSKNGIEFSPFEALSAAIWKCIAKIRPNSEPKVVTLTEKSETNKEDGNNLLISVVKADFPIVEASPSDLAKLIKDATFDEQEKIENTVKKDDGVSDFIIYGANLTFANLENAKFYEFDYNGEKPIYVSYRVDGVGDEGAVFVLPGPPKDGGRTVMAILPENEGIELKSEMKKEWFVD